MAEALFRDFYLGFIRIYVLYHAKQAPVYGVGLMDELSRHGYSLGPGTLYPILHSLEGQGYLTSEKRVAAGITRRYYRITELGDRALEQVSRYVQELIKEIQEEQA